MHVKPWTTLCCTQCDMEYQATRAYAREIPQEKLICEACESYNIGAKQREDEVEALRKKLKEAELIAADLAVDLSCYQPEADSIERYRKWRSK